MLPCPYIHNSSLCGKVCFLRTFLYASTNSSMNTALLEILACHRGLPAFVLGGTFYLLQKADPSKFLSVSASLSEPTSVTLGTA